MSFKNFLRVYYIYIFLQNFVIASAIINTILVFKWLSLAEISSLIWILPLIWLIFELPSWLLADYWWYKKTLVLWNFIFASSFLIWTFAPVEIFYSFLWFLLYWLSNTIKSWTEESFFYENIKNYKEEHLYKKLLWKISLVKQISISISMLISGFIAEYNLNLAIILSFLIWIIAIIPLLFLKDPKIRLKLSNSSISSILSNNSFKELFKYRYLLLLYALFWAIIWTFDEFNQLYYQIVLLPLWSFWVIAFIIRFFSAWASFIAHRFYIDYRKFNYILPFVAVLLFLVWFFHIALSVAFIFIIYVLSSFLLVHLEWDFQKNITSEARATINSSKSFLVEIWNISFNSIFLISSTFFSFYTSYFFISFFVIIIFFINLRKKLNINS